jgi:branched-chain amino acid transport system permease protein
MATTVLDPRRLAKVPGISSSEEDRSSRTTFLIIAVFAVMFIYPFFDEWLGINRLGSWMAIFVTVILAMGLNIVVGYAGLLDLGYAAFFAIGAYTTAFLTSPASYFVIKGWVPESFQNFWVAMICAWVVAAIFGVLLGAPTLRLRGDYLAIVTLGFGEIVPNFLLNAETVTNGPLGINRLAQPNTINLGFAEISFGPTDQRNWYWLMLCVGLLSLFLINRLYDSRLGRSWQAIREDEIAAASMGVNLVRTKLWAFALGASFAGFAGSVYAAAFQYVDPSQFEFSTSVMILSMVILGGLGNVYGVIFGALLVGGFDRILAEELNNPMHWIGEQVGATSLEEHDLTQDRLLIFGLALVVMMLVRPAGLFPNERRKAELQPESEDIAAQESGSMFDLEHATDTALGERA